jgi:hypothetical protein
MDRKKTTGNKQLQQFKPLCVTVGYTCSLYGAEKETDAELYQYGIPRRESDMLR